MSQSNGTDTLSFIYDTDGQAIGVNRNGSNYYYLRNVQGDVIALYNCYGDINCRYTYDSWGNLISVTDANGNAITDPTHIANVNPIRYRGYYYDVETGLYYLQSRYYNPQWGRFINADDIDITQLTQGELLTTNLFAYCVNNPVNNSDPSGYFTIKVYAAAALTAAVIGAVVKIVSNYLNGKRGKSLFRGVLGSSIGSAVNVVLLMKLIRLGGKGMALAAFAAGAVQALFDFLEGILITKTRSWRQLSRDFLFNSAANLAGNFIGARAVYINGNWFQPKQLASFFKKSYGRKLIAQTGIGSILNLIIDLARSRLKKVRT